MLQRLFRTTLLLALLALPLQAAATIYTSDYSDIWYLPAESGWGVNLIQNEDVIFATFFVYGATDQPTWFVAIIYQDGNGNFSGNLFTTVGPYYGGPWNPSSYAATLAGTASFFPSSAYTGTLTYTVNGTTVTKSIQRQTLKTITLGGTYTGGQAGTYGGGNCILSSPYKDTFDVTVTQPGDGTVSLQFAYTSGLSCTLSGTLVQQGQLYQVPNATYVCSDWTNTSGSMDQIKATHWASREPLSFHRAPAAAPAAKPRHSRGCCTTSRALQARSRCRTHSNRQTAAAAARVERGEAAGHRNGDRDARRLRASAGERPAPSLPMASATRPTRSAA